MKKIGVIYGSTTGTTESVARRIADKLGAEVNDVCKISKELVEQYDILILGTSTWGDGELQDDWYDGVNLLQGMDLSGKTVALFGCGDSESYSDTFCDAMNVLYESLQSTGCKFVGMVADEGYTYSASASVVEGKFVGLAIDDVNESDKTDERIEAWTEMLKAELS